MLRSSKWTRIGSYWTWRHIHLFYQRQYLPQSPSINFFYLYTKYPQPGGLFNTSTCFVSTSFQSSSFSIFNSFSKYLTREFLPLSSKIYKHPLYFLFPNPVKVFPSIVSYDLPISLFPTQILDIHWTSFYSNLVDIQLQQKMHENF